MYQGWTNNNDSDGDQYTFEQRMLHWEALWAAYKGYLGARGGVMQLQAQTVVLRAMS